MFSGRLTHSGDTDVDVYTTGGILLRGGVSRDGALDGLSSGVYVVDGQKMVRK